MMICPNGHETSEDVRFCGECGILTEPDTQLCAHGHINPGQRKFCGDCGAPIAPPVASVPNGSAGRWAADPTYRHQFRYIIGTTWTQHVADIGDGTFGIDRPPRSERSRARTATDILIGVILLILIVGAVSAVALLFSRSVQAAPANVEGQQSVSRPTAVPPAQFLPTPTTFRPLAVIGAPCTPSSVNGVQTDGSIAYCEFLADSNTYMWSMYWGEIESPYSPDEDLSERENPNIAVCMMQTGLTRQACRAQIPTQ